MSIKVIVNGAKGKMGQVSVNAVQQEPDLELVAAIDSDSDLAASIQQHQANVVIDFTLPDVCKAILCAWVGKSGPC